MKFFVSKFTDQSDATRNFTSFDVTESGTGMFLLADGSAEPFLRGDQNLVDLVRDTLFHCLMDEKKSMEERISDSANLLVKKLEESDRVRGCDDTFSCCVEFVAILTRGPQIIPIWIGAQQGKLYRNGECVYETIPHVTVFEQQGRPPFIVTGKCLDGKCDPVEYRPETMAPWEPQSGDVIVLADYTLFYLDTQNEIGRIVAQSSKPAEELVGWAQEKKHRFAQSALVARLEHV